MTQNRFKPLDRERFEIHNLSVSELIYTIRRNLLIVKKIIKLIKAQFPAFCTTHAGLNLVIFDELSCNFDYSLYLSFKLLKFDILINSGNSLLEARLIG